MNILTFDIEEWFHLLDNESTKTENQWNSFESRIHRNMDIIYQLLDETNTSATFFCVGWIAKKYPEVIKKIDALGYEIGSHTNMHQLVYTQNKKIFKEDVKTSIHLLEEISGKKVTAFRAPGFSIGENEKWAFDTLIELGIETDSSVFPASRAHGGYQNFGSYKPCIIDFEGSMIKEFPISITHIFGKPFVYSGGGYFRFIPSILLNHIWKKSDYTMTYFHPRDFDSTQPIIKELNYFRKFKSYYGIKDCLQKLKKIIENNKFIDLQTAIKTINWEQAAIIKI